MKISALRNRCLLGLFVLSLLGCVTKKFDGPAEDANLSAEVGDVQKRTAIRMQLAVGYYQQGQHKVALEEIKKILALDANLVDAYNVRALIYMDLGEKQLAEENFLRALKLAPNSSDVASNYGWFLCQNGNEKKALTLFDQVLTDPSFVNRLKALNSAGVCSLRLKDIARAEKYFRQGFEEDPSSASMSANLSKIFYDRAEYNKAKFYISRVIKDEVLTADVLWLAIKIEHRLGDQSTVDALATQLRRRHPNSKEFLSFQRGAFDD